MENGEDERTEISPEILPPTGPVEYVEEQLCYFSNSAADYVSEV